MTFEVFIFVMSAIIGFLAGYITGRQQEIDIRNKRKTASG